MGITWAVISWTVPSYIPVSYSIITYEIGYHVLDNCAYVDINSQLIILSNISNVSTSTDITDLRANTCYLFGVRAYTINGYGLWTVIANTTLVQSQFPLPASKFIVTGTPCTSIGTTVAAGVGLIIAITVVVIVVLIVIVLMRLVYMYMYINCICLID